MAKATITITDVIQDDGSWQIDTEITFSPDLTQESHSAAQMAALRLWQAAERLVGGEVVPS
jgi:hypothetical protein